MGGGKGGTSTTQNFSSGSSSVTIPPEVMARYNAVNQRAEEAASQPFQNYGGEFVAPVNQTQQGGINTITGAANSWSPYFGGAVSQLNQGFGGAYPALQQGQAAGTGLGAASIGLTDQAVAQSSPYNTSAGGYFSQGFGAAQPYNAAAGSNINSGIAGASPYNSAAAGLALAGTGAVNPTAVDSAAIGNYMNPYMSQVVNPVVAQMQQQFGQQQRDLSGSQILNGTFGSDRGGIGKATLANQQDLALGQTVSGLYNQNYAQALAAAQQQQGVGLGAAQANRAALQQGSGQLLGIGNQVFGQGVQGGQALQGLGQQVYGQGTGTGAAVQGLGNQIYTQGLGTANQYLNAGNTLFGQGNTAANTYGNLGVAGSGAYSGLGTQNLQNYLAQGQAQLGAGTVQQQTQQAQDTALYNQFLQAQGYPFQVAQFLAGIAEGTGALSGSTTTSSGTSGGSSFAPQPFFSDERLKEGVEIIGKTNDGIPIVRFRYRGSPDTQVGMLAQDVARKRPEAVGKSEGFLTVDYDAATSRNRKYATGGLVPSRPHMDDGGSPDMSQILALHQAMYPGAMNARGIGQGPRGMQLAPSGGRQMIQGPKVDIPPVNMPKPPEQTGFGQALKGAGDLSGSIKDIKSGIGAADDLLYGSKASGKDPATGGLIGSGGTGSNPGWLDRQYDKLTGGGGGLPGPSTSPSGSITSSPNLPPMTSGDQAAHDAAVQSALNKAMPPSGGQPDATSPTGQSAPAPAPDAAPPVSTSDAAPVGLDASPNLDLASADLDSGLGDGLTDALDFAKRGGRIRRAAGGSDDLPYAQGYVPQDDSSANQDAATFNSMKAPDPLAQMKDATAGSKASSGSSGASDAMSAIKSAAQIASLVAMLNRGGRVGRDGGGGVASFAEGKDKPSLLALLEGDPDGALGSAADSVGLGGLTDGFAPLGGVLKSRGGMASGGDPDVVPDAPPPPNSIKDQATDIQRGSGNTPSLETALNNQPSVTTTPPPTSDDVFDPAREVQEDAAREAAEGLRPAAAGQPAARSSGVAPTSTPATAQNAPASSRPPPAPSRSVQATPEQMDYMLQRSAPAISTIETSTGNDQAGYSTISKPNANGTRDYGKFQVNEANVGPWTQRWVGKAMTPDEFVRSPEAQNAVFKGQFSEYIKQFGTPQRAALAWHGGPGALDPRNGMPGELAWYGKRFTALYAGDKDPGGFQGGGGGAPGPNATGLGAATPASATVGGGPGYIPAGGTAPDGQFDPTTGRTRADPNAGFFDHGGWLDRNQKEVMSGLSFLGNMLGSSSRTLAGSVGQGLAAGAGTYLSQANKEQGLGQGQQQIGQEQQRIDIANRNQLMSLWSTLLARAGGYTSMGQPVPPQLQQMISNIEKRIAASGGQGGQPGQAGPSPLTQASGAPPAAPPTQGGIPAPGSGGGAPVQQTALPPPQQQGALPPAPATSAQPQGGTKIEGPSSKGEPALDDQGLPIVNTTDRGFMQKLRADNNPEILAARARDTITYNPQEAQRLFQQSQEVAARIAQQGYGIGLDGQKVYAPGAIERQEAERRAPVNADLAKNETTAIDARQQMRVNLQHVQDALQHFETGNLSGAFAEVAGVVKAITGEDISGRKMNPTELQTMIKSAYNAILAQGKDAGEHNTNALRSMITAAIPNPEYQPEANKRLLSQMLGQLDYEDKHSRDYSAAYQKNRYLDSNAWAQQWRQDNAKTLREMQDNQYKEMAVRGATPPLADLKPDHVYVIEPGQESRYNLKPDSLKGPTKLRRVQVNGQWGWKPVQ